MAMDNMNQAAPDSQAAEGQAPDQAKPGMAQAGQEQIKALIVGIHTDLLKFKEMLDGSDQIPDQAKANLDDLITEYREFVQGLASGQFKPENQENEAAQGEAPPAQAAAPAPKGPMPMSGGRKAVPVMQ